MRGSALRHGPDRCWAWTLSYSSLSVSCCERGCDSRPNQDCRTRLNLAQHARVHSGPPHSTSSGADSPRSLLPAGTRAQLSTILPLSWPTAFAAAVDCVPLPTAYAVAWSSPFANSLHCHQVVSRGQQFSQLPGRLPWPTAHTVAWSSPMANSFCRCLGRLPLLLAQFHTVSHSFDCSAQPRKEWGHLANPQLAQHSCPFKNQ